MKIILFVAGLLLIAAVNVADAQTIQKVKIEDVTKMIADAKDSIVVVNFWATFCKPCNEELPYMHSLVKKYQTNKIKLLLVSIDLPNYFPNKISDFAKKANYTAPIVWLDENNADHYCPAIDPKWTGSIPATFIVNNRTGYKKFLEKEMKAEEFENELRLAVGL